MPDTAKISIIIPCHNVESYLMRCFLSLQRQTLGLENLELIFVDDASWDNTWKLLTEIEKLAPESVCIVHLDENLRQGGARNVGLGYASAPYIGFVDSDDWVEPDMYEIMYKRITETDSDLVFCRYIRDDGSVDISNQKITGTDRLLTIEDGEQRADFIVSNVIGHNVWDKLYRKSLLMENNILFPEHLAYEDIYFGSLIYLYASKVTIVEKRLYHYFVNPRSTVLGRNLSYHKDIFAIGYMKWNALQQRGFLSQYKDALEFDFLMTFYFAAFKILCLRYDQIPYEDFAELKRSTLERVPDYKQNPYCRTRIPDLYQIVLKLLDFPVTYPELLEIQKAFCAYHTNKLS